jgi:hypothetical protein
MIAAAFLAGATERQAGALPPPGRVPRTPWDFFRASLADKMPDLHRCSTLARNRGTFGDATAHFDWRAKGHVGVEVTKSLGGEIRQCVLDELQPYAAKVYEVLGKGTDFDMSWELGRIRPLFPASDGFLRAWSAATAATNGTAARNFARALPPDVQFVDGCLTIQPPANFAFSQAVDLWKRKRNVKAVDGFWNEKLTAVTAERGAHVSVVSFPFPHLLVHIETHDADRESDPRTAVYPPRRAAPSTNRLCLRPFNDETVAQVKKSMDGAGQCWRSGPLESLLTPRFSFPGGHTYSRVGSTTLGQTCALDVAGEITCCGATTTTLPGRYRDLDVAGNLVCSVSTAGTAGCVDIRGGKPVLTLGGKFKSISASTAGACGLTEGGTIVCDWTIHREVRPPEGTFRQVDAGSLCAIDPSGELICPMDGRAERVGKGPWRQVTSSKTDPSSVCALDGGGRVWCGTTAKGGPTLTPAPTSQPLSRVVMGSGGPCGIEANCGLRCWPGRGPFPDRALCVRDLSLGNPSCVVLQRGQVACGGHDYWVDDPAMKGGN